MTAKPYPTIDVRDLPVKDRLILGALFRGDAETAAAIVMGKGSGRKQAKGTKDTVEVVRLKHKRVTVK